MLTQAVRRRFAKSVSLIVQHSFTLISSLLQGKYLTIIMNVVQELHQWSMG